jgi:hypothetical protein
MRAHNWPTKLAFFFAEKETQPFNWKENNCAFFAADWINICCGFDPVKDFRELSARELLDFSREQPLATIIAAKCAEIGWSEQPVAFAQRGDLMENVERAEGCPALGVCNGALSGFAGPTGVLWIPTLECQRAWRVE